MNKRTIILMLLAGCGAGAILSMVVESIERAYIETDRSRTIREHTRFLQGLSEEGRISDMLSVLREVDEIVESTEEDAA